MNNDLIHAAIQNTANDLRSAVIRHRSKTGLCQDSRRTARLEALAGPIPNWCFVPDDPFINRLRHHPEIVRPRDAHSMLDFRKTEGVFFTGVDVVAEEDDFFLGLFCKVVVGLERIAVTD
jgi:hypothetical protein